MMVLTQTNVDE